MKRRPGSWLLALFPAPAQRPCPQSQPAQGPHMLPTPHPSAESPRRHAPPPHTPQVTLAGCRGAGSGRPQDPDAGGGEVFFPGIAATGNRQIRPQAQGLTSLPRVLEGCAWLSNIINPFLWKNSGLLRWARGDWQGGGETSLSRRLGLCWLGDRGRLSTLC